VTRTRSGSTSSSRSWRRRSGALLIVPPFVSQWRYYKRIARAQELAGLLYLAALFLLPFEIPYGQHHLNRLWEHVATEREKVLLGMRGPVSA